MYVSNLKAEPNACGGQVDLCWKNPSRDEFPNFKGVKIVRRERRFPGVSPPKYSTAIHDFIYDGTLVYDGKFKEDERFEKEISFSDKGLKGETVYYYTLYIYDDNIDPAKVKHFTSRASRIAAMAASNYGIGDELYKLLPAIYQRYDTILAKPGTVEPEDEQKGELQRFLEIFGPQLDLIRSFITGTRNFFDLNKCDGALLPLLAQWIGWQTNLSLDVNSQRNEIQYAPELYKTVGIVANLRAFVNRLTNWDSQIKEFVHNVFISNEPEKLNLWSQKLVNGNWSDAELVSLDFAYGGAPSSFIDSNGRLWLFYHAKRDDQWDIWYKIYDKGKWSPGYRVAKSETIDKYPAALQTRTGNVWMFWSAYDSKTWNIKTKILAVGQNATEAKLISQRRESFPLKDGATLVISVNGATEATVTFKSEDFENISEAICSEVVAVLNRDLPSLTATVGSRNTIQLTSNTMGEGSSLIIDVDASSAASSLGFGAGFPNVSQSDKEPAAFEDNNGYIWLFWSSLREGNWDIWCNKFDGTSWGTEKRLTSGIFPDREPAGVFFNAADPNRKIWVFWSRKGSEGWSIFYRTKPNTDLNNLTWSDEMELSPIPSDQKYDNRESTVKLDSKGNIMVFWSSNRTGSWNILYKIFNKALDNWTAEMSATLGYFTKKAPAILVNGQGNTWLLFRSNESVAYSSKVYPGTTTLDSRYSGSTAIDVRNRERIGLHGKLDDILCYVYDTGKKNGDWYARDTIGIYLTPNREDQKLITRSQELVKGILDRFLPIQLRVVFVINPVEYQELIYTYDFPTEETQSLINEKFFDSTIPEVYPEVIDSYKDEVILAWIWLRSWSEEYSDHYTVDLTATPIDTKYRTWHISLETRRIIHGNHWHFD